jgi:hypothetical protein
MLFLKDTTMSATSKEGTKLTFSVYGRCSAPDVIRGVATIISQNHKGRADAPLILDMLWEAENMVIDRYGQSVKLPKLEAEIEKAKSVADKKADLAKRELKRSQLRAFILGWMLSAFCSALLRVIFG